MIDGGIYEACLLEQGERLGIIPVVSECTCSGMCDADDAFMQVCDCTAEPDIGSWSCSMCGQPYRRLQS
jgi:hypothetical protein